MGIAIFFSIVVLLIGVVVLLRDRITEVAINGVGSIKAAAKQAEVDVAQIQEIREKVEAQGYAINLVAKEASIANERIQDIASKGDEARKLIDALSEAQSEAKKSQKQLESISNFMMTYIRAQNDDRKAYDDLFRMAQEKNGEWSSFAARAYATILDAHSQAFYSSGFKIPWKEGVDPSKLSIDEIIQIYKTTPVYLKPGILEYISSRPDIPKKSKMEIYINVIKNDMSLTAVEYAGRQFTSLANLQIKPLATDYLIDWWVKNKESILEGNKAESHSNHINHRVYRFIIVSYSYGNKVCHSKFETLLNNGPQQK